MATEPDDLGWDRDEHGKMIDHAVSPEEEIETLPYNPEED